VGKRYLLTIDERDEPPSIELKPGRMLLTVRPGTGQARRKTIVEGWVPGTVEEGRAATARTVGTAA
jgi:hypothetical protein